MATGDSIRSPLPAYVPPISLADAVSVVVEMIEDVADAVSFIASEVESEVRT